MYAYDINPESPNQFFTIVMSGYTIGVTLQTNDGVCYASIDIDGIRVKTSVRCVNNQPIIPYKAYIPEDIGNLFFYCADEDYPSFVNFNTSCILVYLSPSEIKELLG